MPKVSVIIPTYNRSQYICQAIDSVLMQIFTDYEIIIVDDGSTDDTREVLKKYGNTIQYLYQKNMGPPSAMNTGIRCSKGEYFVILGDDDVLMPNMLERQAAVLERNPDIAFVCSGTYFMDEHSQVYKTSDSGRYREKSFKSLLFDNFVWHLTVLIRRKISEEMGHLDESLLTNHDHDLWLRIAIKYKFEYTDAPLAKFRRHSGNFSKSLELHLRDHLTILDKKEVRGHLTWIEYMKYRAVNLYRFGLFYSRTGEYLKAARCYWLAILNFPWIGVYFWPYESNKMKFSMPYRFLKPYIAPFFYVLKFLLWKLGLIKISIQTDNLA